MSKFDDLLPRVLSAVVMVVVGFWLLVTGGLPFLLFVALIGGVMIWELARMLDASSQSALLLGAIAGVSIFTFGQNFVSFALYGLVIAPLIGIALVKRDKVLFALYGLAIIAAVVTLFQIRNGAGFSWSLWLILVVIASDVGGYFFGRILGGPKILPKISPKKTWSGTLGGWLLAGIVGALMMPQLLQGSGLIVMSIIAAMAGQIGDIVESRIKRHVGVKDSSTLIPGHGGFLDRFDALMGAALFVLIWIALNGAL